MDIAGIAKRYRIDKPAKFRLRRVDSAESGGIDFDKAEAKALLAAGIARLSELQERLYADDRWAVLVVLQGLDTAGKDGIIKHVMSGINPQGCEVHSFKVPSAEELDHDFLWRIGKRLPSRGRIGIFNRSHYEDVLVVRVHPEILAAQQLPDDVVGDNLWKHRYKDIRAFEHHLARNGTLILKFFLHVSKAEQRRRLLARLDEPAKHWKFSKADLAERMLWDKYTDAYEDMIRATSTSYAPWYVVPADNKWFARLIVAQALIGALDKLGLAFPKVTGPALATIAEARRTLLTEDKTKGKTARGKRASERRAAKRRSM
jgi:PPK2 family polyphosphate:nucleotide phosphotransferase